MMIRYVFLGSFTALSSAFAGFLSWDDSEAGTGLHVKYTNRSGVKVREARPKDLPSYQRLMGNPEVMKTVGSGKALDHDFVSGRLDAWVSRFQEGVPTGRMTVQSRQEWSGFVQLFADENKPGVGEFVFAFDPAHQGRGLGRESMEFLVDTWSPAVRERGMVKEEGQTSSITQKFRAFGGEALRTLYATARPENIASWKCMDRLRFEASPSTLREPLFSCENWEETQHGGLEDWILQSHFSEYAHTRLAPDTRYAITDPDGKPRTLSLVGDYGSLRYHFERPVQD